METKRMTIQRTTGRRRPSAATVLAGLALFFALGGTGYAVTQLPRNSVGSDQVRDGSLLRRDFKGGVLLRGAQGTPGSQGAMGPQGPKGDTGAQGGPGPQGSTGETGATGAKGDTGSQGPSGIAGYTSAYSAHTIVPAGGFRFAQAECPDGTRILAGGYTVEDVSNAILVPTSGYPIGTSGGGSGWYVTMQNLGAEDQAFWVVGFCIPK
jgi:hypothetical protein